MKQHSQTRKLHLWYYGKPRTRENLGEKGNMRINRYTSLPEGGWVGKEVKIIPTLSHFSYIATKIEFSRHDYVRCKGSYRQSML